MTLRARQLMRFATRLMVLLTGLLILCTGAALQAAAQQETNSPEQQLVDLYAPVAYLREQTRDCAETPEGGEPYLPLPVELVLDNPRVLLRDAADDDRVLTTGPDAQELATYGADTYMEFPGDPRRPGCTYETDERLLIDELGLEPTTYARIVYDDAEQRLALQYWFWWYFNDWNNNHEGDWEMIQIMWDEVSGVEEALQVPPSRTAFSQHNGGELANWGDDKIEIEDGTHVRVYPAAGSHATFYNSHTYLGWGENGSGFGCDVSSGPSVRTPLSVVLVEDDPDPNGEFAWLLYEGRWGERGPSVFNGPLGPNLNRRWLDPWGTTDNWRTSSIVVPEPPSTLGPSVTEAFCSLSESGSMLLIYTMVYPWLAIPGVGAVIAVLTFFYRRSQGLLRRSRTLYQAYWKVFLGIGLAAIPIGILFNVLQAFLIERNPLRFVVSWFDNTAGARLSAVFAIGSVQQIAMLLIIGPAVIQAVADIHRGETPGVIRSFRLAAARAVPIAIAALVMLVLAGIPLLSIIGIPVAIWLVVRWQFFTQVLIFDRNRSSLEALDDSAQLVKNRWWETLFVVFIFDLIATVPGILVGFGLMTLGGTAVGFANSISSLIYSLAIPLATIGVTLLFLDRRGISLATQSPESSRTREAQ